MKKPLVSLLAVVLILICISWGLTGHKTVADIAFNHLTPQAKAAVTQLLGNESMADVASWADEILGHADYKQTASQHYINVPLGLSHDAFVQNVTSQPQNVYTALQHNADVLRDTKSTATQKAEALKFVIHFVGDMHQPMHVSRAGDKGGNTIQVRYDGKGTNLHALWDSKLLQHGGMDDMQLAAQYDKISSGEIMQWQKTPVIDWAWESYQLSTQLYADVEKPNGNMIDDAYYQKYMPVIQQRISQAGIRLAGLLNEVFKNGLPGSAAELKVTPAAPAGDSYCETVYGGKYFDNSGMTLLNLGGQYPNNTMTVVIYKKDRGNWKEDPLKLYDGKKICVTGKKMIYQGKPEIVVEQPKDITIQ